MFTNFMLLFFRQKSHDSMDSLDSTESGFIIDTYSAPVQGGNSF